MSVNALSSSASLWTLSIDDTNKLSPCIETFFKKIDTSVSQRLTKKPPLDQTRERRLVSYVMNSEEVVDASEKTLYTGEISSCVVVALKAFSDGAVFRLGLVHLMFDDGPGPILYQCLEKAARGLRGNIEVFIAGGMQEHTKSIHELVLRKINDFGRSLEEGRTIKIKDDLFNLANISNAFFKQNAKKGYYQVISGIKEIGFDSNNQPFLTLMIQDPEIPGLEEKSLEGEFIVVMGDEKRIIIPVKSDNSWRKSYCFCLSLIALVSGGMLKTHFTQR